MLQNPFVTLSTICLLFSAGNGSMPTISSGPQNQQPFEVSELDLYTHFSLFCMSVALLCTLL